MGECEEVLVQLAETPRRRWGRSPVFAGATAAISSCRAGRKPPTWPGCRPCAGPPRSCGGTRITITASTQRRSGPGAEMEVSRGCPYHCTFCAKDNFRDRYRRRPLATILDELDGLIAAGATYVYFIDEIFLPWRELLEALARRPVEFGVQTRIDLWRPDMLDLLGAAGCVSIEAGVESLTPRSATGSTRIASFPPRN